MAQGPWSVVLQKSGRGGWGSRWAAFPAQSMPGQGRRQDENVRGSHHDQDGGNAGKESMVDTIEGAPVGIIGYGGVGT